MGSDKKIKRKGKAHKCGRWGGGGGRGRARLVTVCSSCM